MHVQGMIGLYNYDWIYYNYIFYIFIFHHYYYYSKLQNIFIIKYIEKLYYLI